VPERWIKDANSPRKNHPLHDHPYMILPFSIGPRMCVGARLAELEIFSFISTLVQKYKISLSPDSPIPRQVSLATIRTIPLPKYVIENR
jgi:cytochrome P450